jgi:hypothetical protein
LQKAEGEGHQPGPFDRQTRFAAHPPNRFYADEQDAESDEHPDRLRRQRHVAQDHQYQHDRMRDHGAPGGVREGGDDGVEGGLTVHHLVK